jgi:glycosyltransferase involved in cell wall biosynthesis
MRILIATCNRAIVGGVEKYLQVLLPALLNRGHELALLYENPWRGGVRVDPSEAELPVWFWEDLKRTPALWQQVRRWKPDLVYSHGSVSSELESILVSSYPSVLYAHVYLGTCASGRKCHRFPEPKPCDREFGPMCLVLHYPRRCGGWNPVRALQMFQRQANQNAQLPSYRAVLVGSTHMFREFARHGVDQDKLQLVPLPVAEAGLQGLPFIDRAPCGRILFAGRLTDLKGADYLIRSLPEASQELGRPLSLTLAGDGPERRALQGLTEKLGVAANFTGWIDAEQKLEVMAEADLLAMPSLWPEPFGLAGIEAGSLSIPAVGYAVGGITDWLIPGQTGELAPAPPTVHGLADAIVRAFADTAHYSTLRRGAWEFSRLFTMERHIAKLEQALQAACSGTGSRTSAARDVVNSTI